MDFGSFYHRLLPESKEFSRKAINPEIEINDSCFSSLRSKCECVELGYKKVIPPIENDYDTFIESLENTCKTAQSNLTFWVLLQQIFKPIFKAHPPNFSPFYTNLFQKSREILRHPNCARFASFIFECFESENLGLLELENTELFEILPNLKFRYLPGTFTKSVLERASDNHQYIESFALFCLNSETVEISGKIPEVVSMAAQKRVTNWSLVFDIFQRNSLLALKLCELSPEDMPCDFVKHMKSSDFRDLVAKFVELHPDKKEFVVKELIHGPCPLVLSKIRTLKCHDKATLINIAKQTVDIGALSHLINDLGDAPSFSCEMISEGCIEIPQESEKWSEIANGIARNIGKFLLSPHINTIITVMANTLRKIAESCPKEHNLDINSLDIVAFLFLIEKPVIGCMLFETLAKIEPKSAWKSVILTRISSLETVHLKFLPKEKQKGYSSQSLINNSHNRVNYILHMLQQAVKVNNEFRTKSEDFLKSVRGFSSSVFALQSVINETTCDIPKAVTMFDLCIQTSFTYLTDDMKLAAISELRKSQTATEREKAVTILLMCQKNISDAVVLKCLEFLLTLQTPLRRVYLTNEVPTEYSVLFCFVLLTVVSKIKRVDRWDQNLLQCYEFLRIRAVKSIKENGNRGTLVNLVFEVLTALLIKYCDIFNGSQIVTGFYSISQIVDMVPLPTAYKSLDAFFSRISNKEKTFRRCLSQIPLTYLADFYFYAIFSLKYYSQSAKIFGPLGPLLMSLVALHGRFLYVEDLNQLLSDVPWDGHKEQVPKCSTFIEFPQHQNVLRRHSCVPVRPQTNVHETKHMSANNISHYFAVRLSASADEFLSVAFKVLGMVQRPRIQRIIMIVLKPWLQYVKFQSIDSCSNTLSVVFGENAQKSAQVFVSEHIFPQLMKTHQETLLSSLSEFAISHDIWLRIIRISPNKKQVVEHLISQTLSMTDNQSYLELLSQVSRKFPDILSKEDLELTFCICDGRSSLSPDLFIPLVKFVPLSRTEKSISNTLKLMESMKFGEREIRAFLGTLDNKHPQLREIVRFLLQLKNPYASIRKLAKLILMTDDAELCQLALNLVDEETASNMVERCVVCNLIPLSEIRRGKDGFWKDLILRGQSELLPSNESLNQCVLYGCPELINMLIPQLNNMIKLGLNVDSLVSCVYDRKRVSFRRVWAILKEIPKEQRNLDGLVVCSESRGIPLDALSLSSALSVEHN